MGDILIHIDNSLDKKAQSELETRVNDQTGVRRAAVSQSAHHLMLVDFDQNQTNSLNILHSVTNSGYQAELVGL